MGNPNAPIKLVEYGSLSCPHCAKLANDGMKTLESQYVNSGRVSYEFRSYIIHGTIDVVLTMLARCADPSTFFPMVGQLYADPGPVDRPRRAGRRCGPGGEQPASRATLSCPGRCLWPDRLVRRPRRLEGPGACLPRQPGEAAGDRRADPELVPEPGHRPDPDAVSQRQQARQRRRVGPARARAAERRGAVEAARGAPSDAVPQAPPVGLQELRRAGGAAHRAGADRAWSAPTAAASRTCWKRSAG